METNKQYCPVCHSEVPVSLRYPAFVCHQCADLATDINGRKVGFSNIDMAGGCAGNYADTGEKYNDDTCFIDGYECVACEARFGGIVIQIKNKII